VLGQADPGAGHARRGGEEALREAHAEALDVGHVVVALGQRVDRVAHRVGGEHPGVVARDVRGREVALERDVDREVGEVVAVGPARDLHEAHARLAVVVPAYDGGGHRSFQLPRYVL
jgi:hypothetical protein